MNREEFLELKDRLRESIKEQSNAASIAHQLYGERIHFKEVSETILEQNRWSYTMETIYKIEKDFYLGICWEEPGTEMQSGQATNCEIYEVVPYRKIVTLYRQKGK